MSFLRAAAAMLLLAIVGVCHGGEGGAEKPAEPDDEMVETRARAMDLAAAFANEGFKTRDSAFSGSLDPGAVAVLAVNLFTGNEYWFCAATVPGRAVNVALHDADGAPVDFLAFQDDRLAAAGWSPDRSGPYLVSVRMDGGTRPAAFSLVYCFK